MAAERPVPSQPKDLDVILTLVDGHWEARLAAGNPGLRWASYNAGLAWARAFSTAQGVDVWITRDNVTFELAPWLRRA